MDYNELNKYVGRSKFAKFLGLFFLLGAILVGTVTTISYIDWKTKESNYIKEYAYSDSGMLSYENKGEQVYVEKLYNTDNEIIELDIPDKRTVILYCSKKNSRECIYFDLDNTVDQSKLNPIMAVFITLLLACLATFCLSKKRVRKIVKNSDNGEEYEQGTSLSSIYLFYVFLFAMGVGVLSFLLYQKINYLRLKDDNHIVTATIYSEIYNKGNDDNHYKPVAYYYVDNQRYIYVSDIYEDGNLNENLGKSFELYYDKNNPNKVSSKENSVNITLLIVGICFTAFTFPFVFFKKKIEKSMDKNRAKVKKEQEWKI